MDQFNFQLRYEFAQPYHPSCSVIDTYLRNMYSLYGIHYDNFKEAGSLESFRKNEQFSP